MGRYTVLRLLVFLGCLVLLWLVGLRGQDQLILLVFGAAVLSAVISWFVLREPRSQMSESIARKVEARRFRRGVDEELEDAATDEDRAPEQD